MIVLMKMERTSTIALTIIAIVTALSIVAAAIPKPAVATVMIAAKEWMRFGTLVHSKVIPKPKIVKISSTGTLIV